jgi:hypothetical protein
VRKVFDVSHDRLAGLYVIPKQLEHDTRHVLMTNNVVRFIMQLGPGVSRDTGEDTVRFVNQLFFNLCLIRRASIVARNSEAVCNPSGEEIYNPG